MTKDKAIAELIRIWHSPHLDLSLKAGLAEAIETLKSADGDLISRQAAIEAVEYLGHARWNEYDYAFNDGISKAVTTIKSLPSAEPKTGKWIKVIDEETPNVVKWHYECDQCGAGRFEKGQQYCSRCGTRMLGEDGEEE